MIITNKDNNTIIDNLKELYQSRELIWTFVVRDLKARYRQTSIGIIWALIQPLFLSGVFTLVFSKFLSVSTDGVPYPVFSFIAMTTWMFFSRTITAGSENLLSNYGVFSKVYFPREVIPFSTVISSILDFMISFGLFIVLLFIFKIQLSLAILFFPIIFLLQILLGLALAMFTAGTTVIFRDLRYAYPFLVQILMYASPVIYSVRSLKPQFKFWFYLNPITGIIEGYRSIFLYQELPNFGYLLSSTTITIILLIGSYLLFKKIEKYLADVV